MHHVLCFPTFSGDSPVPAKFQMGPWKVLEFEDLDSRPGIAVGVLKNPGIWTFIIINWLTCGLAELFKLFKGDFTTILEINQDRWICDA